MSLGVALIGMGYWGERLLRVFSALPGVQVRAVADLEPAVLDKVPPTVRRTTDSAAACCSPDVDAVIIATPPASHVELARTALRAGKHCWVEKPLALRVADAAALVELARQYRRTLFVDETFLYDPLVQQARAWVQSGRLGRLYHLSFQRLSMGRVRRDSDIWWNAAPHDLSLLRYLVGANDVQSIRIERFSYVQPDIADVCVGSARLACGASVHMYFSWLSPTRSAQVIAVGSRGMLRYEGRFEQRSLSYYDYAIADPRQNHTNVVHIERFAASEHIAGGPEEPLALAARAFVEAIRTGTPAVSDAAESLATIRLLEEADEAGG